MPGFPESFIIEEYFHKVEQVKKMKKTQKICLIITIIFCMNYALSMLLSFHYLTQLITSIPWLEKVVAFIIGVCAFIDILAFRQEE